MNKKEAKKTLLVWVGSLENRRSHLGFYGASVMAELGFSEDCDMPDDATTSWTVFVSKTTDASVRGFLAEHGLGENDLPAFVEEAVKWRVLDHTITEVREKFADMQPDDLAALIDEAVAASRDDGEQSAG